MNAAKFLLILGVLVVFRILSISRGALIVRILVVLRICSYLEQSICCSHSVGSLLSVAGMHVIFCSLHVNALLSDCGW